MDELAQRCREIVLKAQEALGANLGGYSMLDLVADTLPNERLAALREALIRANVGYPVTR